MIYLLNCILFPLAAVAVVGLVYLNVGIAFWVEDRAPHPRFGFFGMTFVGLLAAEVSLAAYLIERFA